MENYTEELSNKEQPDQEEKRGGCLTTFLVLMIIFNSLTTIFYLVANENTLKLPQNVPSWTIYLFSIFGILNTVFAILVWKWKKIGVYGFILSALVIFGINMSNGVGFTSFIGLLGPAILVLLVKPVWQHLD